jgi:hypothetical protein
VRLRRTSSRLAFAGFVATGLVLLFGLDLPAAAPHDVVTVSVLTRARSADSSNIVSQPESSTRTSRNAVLLENRHPGSRGWRVGLSPFRDASDRSREVEGYASATGVEIGDRITIFVSARPAQPVRADVYRLGWYGGLGGRLMMAGGWIRAATQPRCPMDAATGLIECHWAASLSIRVSKTWTSGLYLAVLTNADRYQAAVPFTVRNDLSRSAFIYVQPVTTYEAYNMWPRDETGRSLYGGGSLDRPTIQGTRAAVAVSFDRPYDSTALSGLWSYDQPFVMWLERAGYDVTYATSVDLDRQGAALLARHRVMISVGHDEYWTRPMYEAVQAALARGVSFAFFGADGIAWQARLAPGPSGAPGRILICYRYAKLDPIREAALKTVHWMDPPVDQPQQSFLGAQYSGIVRVPAAFVVRSAQSWVYAGTNLRAGEAINGLVSGEADMVYPKLKAPRHRSFTILSTSPFIRRDRTAGIAQATVYQAPSGAWVFDAATFGWAERIGPDASPDARVQRMTVNLLDRMAYGT